MLRPRLRLPTALLTTCAAALALLPSSVEAGGDSVSGTRGGEELKEREHLVELSFDRGHATLRVQRTFHNGIDRHDEAMAWIHLPETAVATGLRTLAELDGQPHWYDADLLEAEAAAVRYTELTGRGGYYPKDPALLSWRWQGFLALQVFPVAPQSEKTVDYTLSMPAEYADGRWRLSLPALGTGVLPAAAILDPANPLDQLFVDGEVVARGHHLTLDHEVEIALAARDPAAFELALASVDTGAGRDLIRWSLTLGPKISKLPKRAKLVVILDLSRSLDPDALAAQRQAALAYLSHFVDPALGAEVALLGFNHEVHALSPGLVGAAEAVKLLEQAPLTQRNGSEVGLALAQADALLSQAGRGPRRILLLSDLETAARLRPEDLEPTVEHSRALLHLARVGWGRAELERDDGDPWAPLAAETHGVLWQAWIPDQFGDPDEQAWARAVFEEWARPVRVDALSLGLDGAALEDDYMQQFDASLAEGQGLADLLLSASRARELVVRGKLWNGPIEHRTRPSRSEGDRWSALVFGSELLDELSEAEMMTLATRGGAVSPVTSYLAVEPGVRPSTAGLVESERGGGGSGLGTIGLGSTGLVGSGGGLGSVFDKQGWLEGELRASWRRCGASGGTGDVGGELVLETMTAEILDVGLTPTGELGEAARTCVMQMIWTLELPTKFSGRERWTVAL